MNADMLKLNSKEAQSVRRPKHSALNKQICEHPAFPVAAADRLTSRIATPTFPTRSNQLYFMTDQHNVSKSLISIDASVAQETASSVASLRSCRDRS